MRKLSDHDLAQLDKDRLKSLPLGVLLDVTEKLLDDLKSARDQINQTSKNSSKPPSSDPPWGVKSEPTAPGEKAEDVSERTLDVDGTSGDTLPLDPEDGPGSVPKLESKPAEESTATKTTAPTEAKPAKKRPGKQPGAPGYGRTQTFNLTDQVQHVPERCALCGETLEQAPGFVYTAYDVLDVVVTPSPSGGLGVTYTRHYCHERQCTCGHHTRYLPHKEASVEGSEDFPWSVEINERYLVGPELVSLVISLSLHLHASRRKIQEWLRDWLNIELSIGTINQCIHEAGRILEPVQAEILEEILKSDMLHIDETLWKEQASPVVWLWVVVTAHVTLFMFGRRTREAIAPILFSGLFQGWLMSDGYVVYRDYDQRLRCLAHLHRKARGLVESVDSQARAFGQRALDFLDWVMNEVYAARLLPTGPPENVLYVKHLKELDAFWDVCSEHWECEHEKTRALAREFIYDWDAIWAVMDYPGLPLTNNAAERALRSAVIHRRICMGTRNPQGSRVYGIIASVIATCRQRSASPWTFIAEAVCLRRQGFAVPKLPPVPQAVVA